MVSKAKSRVHALRTFNRQLIVGMVGVIVMGVVLFIIVARPGTSSVPVNASDQVSGNVAGIAASMTLPTIDGQTVALPGNPGQITVLYTMGYWCSTCVSGAKTLAQLQPEYAKRG